MKTSWMPRVGVIMAVLLLGATLAQAQGTQLLVSNVQAQQRQFTATWDVTYDLETVGDIAVTVSLYLSTDSGVSYPNLCATVNGDVGVGVLPGIGKHMVWNAGADLPGLSSPTCRLRVTADDGQVETTVWDVGDDFSPSLNPSGAWTYGWRSTPSMPLSLYIYHGPFCSQLQIWQYNISLDCPCVFHNPQPTPVQCNSMVAPSNGVVFHPGPNDQQSVVRWTAPAAVEVGVNAYFRLLDSGSTRVTIYHNSTALFSNILPSRGESCSFSTAIHCQTGDVIDCAVNSNGSFYSDSTLLDVVVSSAPAGIYQDHWGLVKRRY